VTGASDQSKGQSPQIIYPLYPVNITSTICKKSCDAKTGLKTSVADPGCLSRVPDPDFYPSRIPDPGSRIQKQQQKRGVKKNFCHTFLCSHKFHKIEHYFSFEVLKKKIWANFQRIIELFTQKIVTKL
jgi:hypothetical protein